MDWFTLDDIHELVLVVDGDHDVVYANSKAKELYGEGEQTCYSLSRGLNLPRYEAEGCTCPIKNIKDSGIDKSEVVHVHKKRCSTLLCSSFI
ncbi:MAG: PAS domain-containing protein [Aquificaceae bacterium]|nr:PAS domain-containing protein [Aquificaceae bacterium]